jgi:hypothetical protein
MAIGKSRSVLQAKFDPTRFDILVVRHSKLHAYMITCEISWGKWAKLESLEACSPPLVGVGRLPGMWGT